MTLTQDQIDALHRCRTRWGLRWKSKLKAYWASGKDTGPDAALLRQLRYNFGPVWLTTYQLP